MHAGAVSTNWSEHSYFVTFINRSKASGEVEFLYPILGKHFRGTSGCSATAGWRRRAV